MEFFQVPELIQIGEAGIFPSLRTSIEGKRAYSQISNSGSEL